MLASVASATLLGVEGRPVRVEVHVSTGLPGFTVVGLPDTTCREARDRVRAALLSSGLAWPNARVTVNLAPPGVRKVGAGLDLAIAVGLLVASEQLPPSSCEARRLRRRAGPRRLGAGGARRAAAGRRARRARGRRARRLHRRGAARRATCDPSGGPPARSWWTPSSVGSPGPTRLSPRRCPRRRPGPTWPTCGASPPPGSPSRWPPPAATTCCWSARRGRARRCWPAGCRACCPTSTPARRSRPPASTRPPGYRCRRAGSSAARRSGRRTTGRPRSRWSAAARARCSRARSAWPTAACCSSTSWASSSRRCSTPCASRWRRASSGWPGPRPR